MISSGNSEFDVMAHGDNALEPTSLGPVCVQEWRTAGIVTEDHRLVLDTLAHAYFGASKTVRRSHEDGITHDLPIGAALCIPGPGDRKLFLVGNAKDRESGNSTLHAEMSLIRNLERLVSARAISEELLTGLTLGVTAECCPACIHGINDVSDELGISRVVYGVPRQQWEELGIVKAHNKYAADYMDDIRRETGEYRFDLFAYPDTPFQSSSAIQSACLELLLPFARDPQTEEVVFQPKELKSTRIASYLVNLSQAPSEGIVQPGLTERIIAEFDNVLRRFEEPLTYVPGSY